MPFVGAIACASPAVDTADDGESPWACGGATNAWPYAVPPSDPGEEGLLPGGVLPDFALADARGDRVCLWQFVGHPLVVQVAPMWASPVGQVADDATALLEEYADAGLLWVGVVTADLEGALPDADDLAQWADVYGLAASPIVADDESAYGARVNGPRFDAGLWVVGADPKVVADLRADPRAERIREALDGP